MEAFASIFFNGLTFYQYEIPEKDIPALYRPPFRVAGWGI
jgi:hypothetical protein